ncbi:DNA polymerase I [Acidithiobacillus sp. IBUN Pt1247-S3]|uniref:DNA polymerase I n=1 Tax=Acidithiobacillus sp. IBUN Pt1247-S3 TaxID=3166642 RepID=UPI0034E61CD0
MTENPRILVDASSFLYRAFHALPDLRAPDGLPTGAIYGVINMLRRLEREYPQGEIIVIFDAPGPTFRDDIYPEYKAQRPPMPPELRVQVEPLLQWIGAMGLPLLREPGVEADDVIGTLACATEVERPVLIISGDKDLAQLVDIRTKIIDTMKNTVLDEVGVQEKFGVTAGQIVDYLALVGDKVDNIPGVPSAGPKTVAKWLGQYGNLTNLLAHADDVGGKVGEALRSSRDFLPRSYELARIRCDLPLPGQGYQRRPANSAALLSLAERLGFSTWRRELQAQQETDGEVESPVAASDAIDRSRYRLIDTEDALCELLVRLQATERVAIDTETTSLNPHDAELVGVSVAWQEGDAIEAAYLPLGHREGKQIARERALMALRPWLESARPKLAQNAKFDWQIFWAQGVQPQGLLRDTLLASYVLDSNGPHDLDHLAQRFLQHENIHYEDVAGKGKKQRSFAEVAIAEALPYAAEDADVCLRLDALLWPRIEKEPGLLHVFSEIEMPLVPVLARMEWAGVKIDRQQLEALSSQLAAAMEQVEREAQEMAGQSFNLSSPKQIQEILFDKMQLPSQKKTKGGQASTDEDSLAQLAGHSPLPGLILEYRSLAKLRNTYADALPQMIHPRTGRVHTHYRQAVAATGRLSSSDPNLQNIPVRTEQGRRIRAAFIAEPGHLLLSADYSQIELRIMAHLSQDASLLAAFAAGEDIHRATAAEVFAIPLEEVDSEQRRAAKAINFGLIYGQTAFGLAQQLGVDQASARAYMQRYFERYPGVQRYMEDTRVQARKVGFVETLFGRRLYVPEIQSRNPARRNYAERAAINAPLQGTAADLIKLAMIAVDAWLQEDPARGRMILQVHDELILEVPEAGLADATQALRARMEGVAKLAVPLEVSVGWGASWAEAHS